MSRIALYDTTLRDGCQSEDVAFTLEDKLRIAEELDACGVSYIEGGWPGSNPRDREFFPAVRKLNLRHAKVAAFGSTRRAGTAVEDDLNLRQLLKAQTPVVTIVGKTWDLHVRDDLRISRDENLDIIGESIAYLKRRVDEVFFDAEHFFDGYKADAEYTLKCLRAAAEAGADVLVLCDTRGGSMPHEIREAVGAAAALGATAHRGDIREASALGESLRGGDVHGTSAHGGDTRGESARGGDARADKDEPDGIALGASAVGGAARGESAPGGVALGIHCHNDCELAVANSLAAVEAGATQVQGTINGFGERCGNANLCSVIPNLQLKLGRDCVSPEQLKLLPQVSAVVYELANIEPFKRQAYVGASAFAHKGGLHVAAVQKNSETYEHIDPQLIGNMQRVLVSDLSGRSNVIYKARQFGFDIDAANPAVKTVLDKVKQLENAGYQYEGADASFELLIQEALGGARVHHFRLISFRVSDEKLKDGEPTLSEATVRIEGPDGRIEHTVAQGNGPLNALDRALRKALTPFYPELNELELLDYKVRVLGGGAGTQATVRVLIESGDSRSKWGTVGVSTNVLEASWQALVDSIDYKLYKDRKERHDGGKRASVDA